MCTITGVSHPLHRSVLSRAPLGKKLPPSLAVAQLSHQGLLEPSIRPAQSFPGHYDARRLQGGTWRLCPSGIAPGPHTPTQFGGCSRHPTANRALLSHAAGRVFLILFYRGFVGFFLFFFLLLCSMSDDGQIRCDIARQVDSPTTIRGARSVGIRELMVSNSPSSVRSFP